jgi:F-type H+-transporting ATPase subunit epsilon
MKTFTLKIITPEKLLLEKEVRSVTLPLETGEATLLPEHEAYMALCKAGEIIMQSDAGEESFATSGGAMEFHGNVLVLLADTAEAAKDIDLARAEEAKTRAEEIMSQEPAMDEETYERTQAILAKELSRMKVARRHASRRGVSLSGE